MECYGSAQGVELEQLPSGWEAMDQLLYRVRAVTFGWNNTFWLEAMDQLLYGVRTDTFSWEALNQPIACVLVPG